MRNRIVGALVAAVVAVSLCLGGCQGQQSGQVRLDPKNPTVVVVWHYYNGTQKKAFDDMVSQFNESVGQEQGIIVEAYSQGNVNELMDKVVDAANGKVGTDPLPQIFAAYGDTAYAVDALGKVADLDPYMTEQEQQAYVDAYLDEGRFDAQESLKIFPVAKSTEVFMLNTTDWEPFAQATGASKDDLATWEGLARVAKAYYEYTDAQTEQPNDGKTFFGRDAMANYMLIGLMQQGVELFKVENGKAALQLDEAAVRKLWDAYYSPYIRGYFGAYGRFRSDDAKTGDIIALVGSTSGAAYFPDQVVVSDTESYTIQAEVLPPPVFEGGEKVAVQQGAGMVVAKGTPEEELASVTFLKWFTEGARNTDFSIVSGYMPVTKAACTEDSLRDGISRIQSGETSENLLKTLPVALQVTNSYRLYTSKPFDKGAEARDVLENALQDQAQGDREQVLALLEQGTSLEEAAAQFDNDEHFAQWYALFTEALEQAMG